MVGDDREKDFPMKCPRCWAQKGYLRQVSCWKAIAMACLLLRPMKCHHCYHKFVVFWFSTIGKQIVSPPIPSEFEGESAGVSCSVRYRAAATRPESEDKRAKAA